MKVVDQHDHSDWGGKRKEKGKSDNPPLMGILNFDAAVIGGKSGYIE